MAFPFSFRPVANCHRNMTSSCFSCSSSFPVFWPTPPTLYIPTAFVHRVQNDGFVRHFRACGTSCRSLLNSGVDAGSSRTTVHGFQCPYLFNRWIQKLPSRSLHCLCWRARASSARRYLVGSFHHCGNLPWLCLCSLAVLCISCCRLSVCTPLGESEKAALDEKNETLTFLFSRPGREKRNPKGTMEKRK